MGRVSYRLALPPQMSQVHPVFHVSLLRRYIADLTHVLSVQEVDVRADLSYLTYPVAMVHRQTRVLRNKKSEPGKDTVARTRVRRMHLGSGAGNERRISPTILIKR